MQIRTRLTLQFLFIVAIIMMLASVSIYLSSAGYRKEDFFSRLMNRANITARLLIEVEEVDAALLRKIEKDNPVSLPKEKIIIYDYTNQVLYSSDDEKTINATEQLLDKIRLEGEVRFRQNEYEVLGFLFADKYDRFVVIAAATDIYGIKKLKNLRLVLVIVSLSSLFLFLIAGWFFAGRALKPISGVIRQVDEITIFSIGNRVNEGNEKDEIAQLAQTFNKMLDRLETAFKVQKNFIANASHEIRTPLTAVTGQLEVLQIKDRPAEEYRAVIDSVLEDMKGLNQLFNRLLILAQASSEVPEMDFKPVRVDEVTWQAREHLIRRYNDYNIFVTLGEVMADERKMTVNGDEQLLKTAIINIMDNGCKYSPDHTIKIHLDSAKDNLSILFSDQGIGIDQEDIVHIFKPFHRGKNVQQIKGHGIGLSLVEKIVSLHQGNIQTESILEKGTTIIVTIPLISSL
jgi:signal transduction histidine kinase